ncbi:MAG: hypothetical protein ACTHJX_03320 [Terriglobales bacterium]|jgi:hypothetical protein
MAAPTPEAFLLALGDVALLSLDQRLRQAAQGLVDAVAPAV